MRCATIAFSGWSACQLRDAPAPCRPRTAASSVGRAASAAGATSRRCRAPRTSPTAPRAAAACRRTVGQSLLDHVLRDAPLHRRALRVREGVQHVAPRARERAHVARAPPCRLSARFTSSSVVAGVHRHLRLLVGEQDPVAVLLRQLAPRHVDVVAERDEDVAQVLPLPRRRPRGDRALADRERSDRAPSTARSRRRRGRARGTSGHAPSGVFGENASA